MTLTSAYAPSLAAPVGRMSLPTHPHNEAEPGCREPGQSHETFEPTLRV